MKQKRIIIVEDDRDLLENMVKYLTLAGYEVTGAASAGEFYYHLSRQTYLLAVLDIGLPDQSGLVLAEYLRKNTSMWIIMLTARSTLDDKLAGLKCGADFYLVKPIDCSELAATIANVFARFDEKPAFPEEDEERWEPASAPWKLERSGWILITPKGDSIKLTSKEFEFIASLDVRKKTIVARRDLLKILDYPSTEQASHALESMVSRLRKKIEEAGCEFPVKTSHGTGYCLSADIISI
ncbi:MAG: response regulator transcription factor [Chlorobium sp.]|nr:MAG: response regulator transcription factor [Chlorobium sp.]